MQPLAVDINCEFKVAAINYNLMYRSSHLCLIHFVYLFWWYFQLTADSLFSSCNYCIDRELSRRRVSISIIIRIINAIDEISATSIQYYRSNRVG
jgi:hypothetical protein